MVCFYPLTGYRSPTVNENGRRPIFFSSRKGFGDVPIKLACGQCSGCRLERSRQWAVRCLHESKLYENNCFITLTYSDNNLPPFGSLLVKDVQDFMKRLRWRYGSGIRVFYCGEYGPKLGRPHYHAILFNHDFKDKKFMFNNGRGEPIFSSEELDDLWEHRGITSVGAMTFDSAAYCARYCMKKINGKMADSHYEVYDLDTGERGWRVPEFAHMSRRGGIGKGHLLKYLSDVYPSDFVVVNGVKARPPRFYDGLYEVLEPQKFSLLKKRRVRNAKRHSDNNTPDRLKVRAEVLERKLEHFLKRS